jgi:hypothetical protein
VVLPLWTDCYDYAQRVEVLGIGRLGNRDEKPRWVADKLARELSDALFGLRSHLTMHKAREMADLCAQNGSGAANAAAIILEECQRKLTETQRAKR